MAVLLDFPLGGLNDDTAALVVMARYSERLQHSLLPKLLLYSIPGFFTPVEDVVWCRDHLPNLTVIDLGYALHFAQETLPGEFRQSLSSWYASLEKNTVAC